MKEIGAYRLLEPIGQGTTGLVFKAERENQNGPVALKVIRPGLARNPDFAATFLRECRFAASLSHPHLAKIHDVGEAQGILFVAREYVGGVDYGKRLQEQGPQKEEAALSMIERCADALKTLSQAGLAVRCIAPYNIVVGADGTPKICGAGLGRLTAPAASTARQAPPQGRVAFMAPEQIRGARDLDERAGVYSLGVALFMALTGVNPFVGRTPQETASKAMMDPQPDPRSYCLGIGEAARELLLKAMRKSKSERYATIAEMAEALKQARIGASAPEPPPAPAPETKGMVLQSPPVVAEPAAPSQQRVRYHRGVKIVD